VVRALDDPRITVLESTENTGPAGARNRALRIAGTELIAFLDADDLWLPEYLDSQVRRYDEESTRPGAAVGAIACNALLEAEDGTVEPGTYHDMFRTRELEPVTVEKLLRRNTVFVSCLVPRAVGEEVGWFDLGLFGTEDHDLWLKIVESGRRIVIQHEPLAIYKRTSASISRNTERQALNNQRTIRRSVGRGRLTTRQRRVARSELRYNRALEAVSAAAIRGRRPPATSLPVVVWIAVSRPRHWGEWATALRSR
jgi:GT2 family glycosyltransferase